MGFWVASTRNGSARTWLRRATVTRRSCMASSSADWVFGVARLISSASTRLAKIGPGSKRKVRAPPSSTIRLVPVMSAGMRSGVNWTRLASSFRAWASVRTSSVLPRPGTPSSRTWPPARIETRTPRTTSSWPTMTLATSRSILRAVSTNSAGVNGTSPLPSALSPPAPAVLAQRREVVADEVLHAEGDVAVLHRLGGALLVGGKHVAVVDAGLAVGGVGRGALGDLGAVEVAARHLNLAGADGGRVVEVGRARLRAGAGAAALAVPLVAVLALTLALPLSALVALAASGLPLLGLVLGLAALLPLTLPVLRRVAVADRLAAV